METQILELLTRLTEAAERIADSLEAQAYDADPDAAPSHDLSGRPIR